MDRSSAVWWKLVRFGFRLLYNEFAFTYDAVSTAVSLGAWRCWQRAALQHLSIPHDGLVLELAHGTGNLQLDLYAAGYQSIGYDLSPYMGRISRNKMLGHRLLPRLVRGKAQQLPFSTGIFSAVVSTFPTDFIVAPETLREVYRVLQPDGQFIIVPNGILSSGGVAEAGLEWLYRVTGQRSEDFPDIKHFFESYGLEAHMLQERCPHSVAQVILARKKVLHS